MADPISGQTLLNSSDEQKLTENNDATILNNDEIRFRNREQLIEKLERVIQEKNASIAKLEESERDLQETLKRRNAEFSLLEAKLRQYEEKTKTFEELHHLQLQTFERTIRDCQIENERLCEQITDLNREINGKDCLDAINQEKLLTFDRIVADTQLWREKLDSYKRTIEQREETIMNLKKELHELQKKKQTNSLLEENSLRFQITSLQNNLRDRDDEIKQLKLTLRRVRDTLAPNHLSHESRWKSCSGDIGRSQSLADSFHSKRSISPSVPLDIDVLKTKFLKLTDRLTNVQQLLVTRDNQIVTLKKVHDKRWARLKHLQKQYRLLKDELQAYTDDETAQMNARDEFSYRRAIQKSKNGCSVCNEQRWRKPLKSRKLKQEDDDNVWNEVTRLRRENARLTNENLSLNEKVDLQEVEINEQVMVIDELRQEIHRINENEDQVESNKEHRPTTNTDQQRLIEELERKLYKFEGERTALIFDNERLKTNYDLCAAEKQHLLQQKTQINSELKTLKLRILSLQDQIHKLKRMNQTNNKKDLASKPALTPKRGITKRKPKKSFRTTTKSCLELLLDQDATLIDDLQNESLIFHRRPKRPCSLCDFPHERSFKQRTRRISKSSMLSKQQCSFLKKPSQNKTRLLTTRKTSNTTRPSTTNLSSTKAPSIRIATLRNHIEQLQNDLARSRKENEHLNQRLVATLSRINILKTTNQKLTVECDKLKNGQTNQCSFFNNDTTIPDNIMNTDNLYERLKNASFDAAQLRKLNKTLQNENEVLSKSLQSLTEKLTHTERDAASKRLLIENYKARLNEMGMNTNRSNDKTNNENDDERVKSLTETADKLRTTMDSYKNRLQAITREKHDLDLRYNQLVDEHQKLKTRFEDSQTKSRLNEQQLRQTRLSNEQLNQDLTVTRQLFEQQLLALNTKTQDSLKQITGELDRSLQRLNDYEKFITDLLQDLIRRSIQTNDKLKRLREHRKQRESLSVTLPGYDSAITTASKILNLTQDDLDEIMSIADDSFQANLKEDHIDKNDKLRQKVSKLLVAQEECAGRLLKIFIKKLDELQAIDRELSMIQSS